MNIYSVINMDIVGSREIEGRAAVQEELKQYFRQLYIENRHILVAPITFTLGDEWQIVLRDVKESYNMFLKIKDFLLYRNINCYCGVGIGSISTEESEDTREMDGKAFIYARKALICAKETNTFYNKMLYTKDCKVIFIGDSVKISNSRSDEKISSEQQLEVAVTSNDDDFDIIETLNAIIQNNEILQLNMTEKQREVISLYESLGSYGEIERKHPRYTKSSISRKLSAANYFLVEHNRNIIKGLLSEYCKMVKEQN
ncbi:SatD family protein [Clostridium folliculivorans]|uniref:SatD family (SatD) n=1 Tax=Clostridium folliculivorans TaxID=2886038 RepID=A0A9W5Y115_9CLOT|nr:SatD family protein [Clostridium folliculivorans]GKU24502.1 hypothetical protein CFOLD11_13280 [Clostridium folliculivorans]GKU30600.1 hypothetical protein CFB3_27070 [Clostridium folliculivorans]